ncbi:RAI1 like PD-XK nuclease-domain-containing protein [Peziza echinospora]|nr:RAI1 like PD-XK nuclease-domain-containing protein [Peziza echinospora]
MSSSPHPPQPATFRLPPQAPQPPTSTIRRPQSLTTFSFDKAHALRHDNSSLKWYWPPTLGADLSRGFDTFVKHDDAIDEHLDALLSAMVKVERETGAKTEADFVTWRGMMTKMLCLPFDRRSSFEMNATKFQDTIFIEENHTHKMSIRGGESRQNQLFSFWGYKFETLSTLPEWWADCTRDQVEQRDKDIVNNEEQFCVVVKTGFNKIRAVLGGEVDAIWNGTPNSQDNPPVYVELKTSKTISSEGDKVAFERKMMRFWAQSFLLGVPKIIVGFRDRDGYLEDLDELDTTSLPGRARKSGRNLWDGNTCINFAAALLEWLKSVIVDDGRVWRIRYRDERVGVEVFPVEGHDGASGISSGILSKEFLDWRMSAKGVEESSGGSEVKTAVD